MSIKKVSLYLVIFMLNSHMSVASSDSEVSSFIESDSWDDFYQKSMWDERFEKMYTLLLNNIHEREIRQKTELIALSAFETEQLKDAYEWYQADPAEEKRQYLLRAYLAKFKEMAKQAITFLQWACPRKPNQLIAFENPTECDGNKSVTVTWIASGRVRAIWPITYSLKYKDLVELELILSMQWFEPLHSLCGNEIEAYRPLWDALNSFIKALEKLMPDGKLPPRMHCRN